ncbi:hypothetical protein MGG_17904 [Pyricularia oryzae 70-15]|uniref:Uncharacterized protein n=2 Tax=Pyricularia oryzae TaxID=318829 RepID=G5EH79_PYRO7|nr:uncharacterized protein MGG_17904 [Pyricularia oryzae 70-15]EAQ71337.1 hypothetical protein MGCH7_ch7g744 [Pyricularia oryzae 70-15]EHA45993.1 hypothetical protein MGG_17904 [Pyricularia oryzae 70-15]ELQ40505.1 hypothetical protein OOU_Y34scaffold00430g1 [Pyricularia oryzae Y34]
MDRKWRKQEANAVLSKTGNGARGCQHPHMLDTWVHVLSPAYQVRSHMTKSRCKGGGLSWRQTMFNLSGVSTISINPGTGETKGVARVRASK